MATPSEMDMLCSQARITRGSVLDRIPEDRWNEALESNEDLKTVLFIEKEVLKSKFEQYLSYIAIEHKLTSIEKKYEAMPDLLAQRIEAK
ncbi:hypothetical protein AGMMS50229_18580 [Campylobacterota bacterium]|nr:hypothetical protein AGMMS50229_18580 [Campylobacterota bacterium]